MGGRRFLSRAFLFVFQTSFVLVLRLLGKTGFSSCLVVFVKHVLWDQYVSKPKSFYGFV